ncbi:MAG: glycosyltransferase [candidate division KSB1 bacterium]|nr:glycosyltransferase [candidate division KSB1 bacterium]
MVSVLLPVFEGQVLEPTVEGLGNASNSPIETVVLAQNEAVWRNFSHLKVPGLSQVVFGPFPNLAAMMNRGVANATGELIAYLPPNIRLKKGAIEQYLRIWQETRAAWVYADYEEVFPDGELTLKRLRDENDNITERASLGYVKVLSREAFERLGGFDERYNRAEDYDFRLRLMEHYRLAHIPTPLYEVLVSPQAAEERRANVGASKLFFPGEGRYGGFSYLFYDKEEEREIEQAFYAYLRRQGAYLTHPNRPVQYAPGETFPLYVTVVTPCFNRARYIGRAIESVLANKFPSYEMIVVDNGSTDGSQDVVESYERKTHGKVRLIRNDKNVIAYSLNLGVRAAQGKYISQLDSDDEYTPDTLGAMVEYLESHPECALAISYYDLIDPDGAPLHEFGIIRHLEYNRNNILRVDGAGAVRTWHKKVILEFGGFNEDQFGHYGEDYDLVLKVSEKYEVGRVHQVLYHYRRHPDNTDAKRDPEMKLRNKMLARHLAIERRKRINERIARGLSPWE